MNLNKSDCSLDINKYNNFMQPIPRIELKYRLPFQGLPVEQKLFPIIGKIEKHEKYQLMSTYYDTNKLDLYRLKEEGEFFKLKLRIRQYEKGILFCELKKKHGEIVYKQREILKEMPTEIHSSTFLPYYSDLKEFSLLIPVISIYYLREAYEFYLNGERFRLTIDKDIRAAPPGTRQQLLLDETIVEIKAFHPTLNKIKTAISLAKKLNLSQIQFSKYAQAIRRYKYDEKRYRQPVFNL